MTRIHIARGEHECVLGMTGAGKTFAVRNDTLPAFNRILVVDSEEYDFNDFPLVNIKTAVKLFKSDYSFVVRFVPRDAADLETLCAEILQLEEAEGVVYIDEVTDFSDPSTIGPMLRWLIRKGRKRGITVIVGTQRPQGLNKWFLANCIHQRYFFIDSFDLEYLGTYAKPIAEGMRSVPYKSFRSLYKAPGGEITILGPAEKYDWSSRLPRKEKVVP